MPANHREWTDAAVSPTAPVPAFGFGGSVPASWGACVACALPLRLAASLQPVAIHIENQPRSWVATESSAELSAHHKMAEKTSPTLVSRIATMRTPFTDPLDPFTQTTFSTARYPAELTHCSTLHVAKPPYQCRHPAPSPRHSDQHSPHTARIPPNHNRARQPCRTRK
jgi:hypothetical protein